METTTGITFLNNPLHRTLYYMLGSSLLCVSFVLYSSYNHHHPSLSSLRSLWITPITAISGSDNALASTTTRTNATKYNDLRNYNLHEPKETATETKHEQKDPVIDDPRVLNTGQAGEKCDIFDGKWVYDPQTRPLYKTSNCPFLSNQVACQNNGRPDQDYEKWRWEARHCEIPRFNGTEMLEGLRGKRVIIVGDSLNRNMWESLACLLYSSISSEHAKVDSSGGSYKVFKAKDYDCSVEFYWSPFLVQLLDKKPRRILKLDKPHVSARKWKGASIMVFNTGHWWTHTGKMQAWDYLEHEGKLLNDLPLETAFQMAMKAWADWIDQNVDPSKTRVFFRSISPEHKGNQWCHNRTQPIKDESYMGSFPRPITEIVEKTIKEMKVPVKYLNITKLSQYRIDAHSTIYTTKAGKLLNKEQRKQPESYADCSHWCLPGLPDTWNLLLYALTVPEPLLKVHRSPFQI